MFRYGLSIQVNYTHWQAHVHVIYRQGSSLKTAWIGLSSFQLTNRLCSASLNFFSISSCDKGRSFGGVFFGVFPFDGAKMTSYAIPPFLSLVPSGTAQKFDTWRTEGSYKNLNIYRANESDCFCTFKIATIRRWTIAAFNVNSAITAVESTRTCI